MILGPAWIESSSCPAARPAAATCLPFANVKTACIDPFDVGAVGTTALLDDGDEDQTYVPTGPESLLPEQQVEILAQALGIAGAPGPGLA